MDIEPDRAVAMGVIVNELVLNAMKYAYPGRDGPIRVELKRSGSGRAMLSVEDDGIGHDAETVPKSTGLGRRIVRAIAGKLGADVVYDSDHAGTRVVIAFDVAAGPAAAVPQPLVM